MHNLSKIIQLVNNFAALKGKSKIILNLNLKVLICPYSRLRLNTNSHRFRGMSVATSNDAVSMITECKTQHSPTFFSRFSFGGEFFTVRPLLAEYCLDSERVLYILFNRWQVFSTLHTNFKRRGWPAAKSPLRTFSSNYPLARSVAKSNQPSLRFQLLIQQPREITIDRYIRMAMEERKLD